MPKENENPENKKGEGTPEEIKAREEEEAGAKAKEEAEAKAEAEAKEKEEADAKAKEEAEAEAKAKESAEGASETLSKLSEISEKLDKAIEGGGKGDLVERVEKLEKLFKGLPKQIKAQASYAVIAKGEDVHGDDPDPEKVAELKKIEKEIEELTEKRNKMEASEFAHQGFSEKAAKLFERRAQLKFELGF